MNEKTRLGAAVVGGYLLGRTKKGGTAVRLAMWLNGTSTGTLARDGLRRLRGSPEINKLLTQAGQPLMEAARGAAVAAVEARLSGLSEGLSRRTSKLLPSAAGDTEAKQPEQAEDADHDQPSGEREGAGSGEERQSDSKARADQESDSGDTDDASARERERARS